MHLELGSLPSKALLLTLYSGILISSSSGKSIPHHLSHDKTRVALREASSDAAGFDYATQKIRGVNIGGWLVTEPWITPSVYETNNPAIIDEKKEAGRRLREHWDSFYTEADFHTIKSFGLNHVRIPIGYWAFDVSGGEPYVQGQFDYLLQAVGWSRNAGLKVLIDLDPRMDSITPAKGVQLAGMKIKAMLNGPKPRSPTQVVVGIQALNEPAGFKNEHMVNTIKDFYKDSYDIVRHTSGPQTHLLLNIHDAFLPLSTWANTFPPPQHHGVSLDTHIYTVFTPEGNKMSEQERIHEYCKKIPDIQASQSKIWTWVGEFTPAPTDCAPLLNGIGRGSRYDGSFEGSTRVGSCESKTGLTSEFSEEYKESLGKFFEIQTKVYEHGSGWFMWTFKAEKADDWSYEAGVKGGWIPKNLDHKKYGVSC
ncbi:hypothetical protein H4Q26_008178 [Puccinia striiformis f. sp. tritici PST-130]|nr:hypothetical protein H4Q26_008178 [Puccinia striiformis f. sp. tritici PST-130]